MRHRQSLPNLAADTRSEVSAYTVSSGTSRNYRGGRISCDVLYQEVMDIGRVSANFRVKEGGEGMVSRPRSRGDVTPYRLRSAKSLPHMQYAPRPPEGDRYGSSMSLRSEKYRASRASDTQGARASYSHIVDRVAVQVQYPEEDTVNLANLKHVPAMLLANTRPKPDIYTFMKQLQDFKVIPADPKTQIFLASAKRPASGVSSVSSVSTDLDEEVLDTDDSGYIDSYVNIKDVKKQRKDTLRARFEAKLRKKRNDLERQRQTTMQGKDNCPHCQALYDMHGGKTKFLNWFWGRWAGGERSDIEDIQENMRKSHQPHFCNFVKKIDLSERDDEDLRRTRSTSHAPVRAWLGDTDEFGGAHGRIIEAKSASESSLIDAASLSMKLRRGLRAFSRSSRSKTPGSTDYDDEHGDWPDEEDEEEEVDLEKALQSIKQSRYVFSSEEETESEVSEGGESSKRSSSKRSSSGMRSSGRKSSSRPRSRRTRSGADGTEQGSDYGSGSEISEYSDGGTRYTRISSGGKRSSVRVPSAGTMPGSESYAGDEEDDEEEEEEEEEDTAFGNEEMYQQGEDNLEEAMLAFKYYDDKKPKDPEEQTPEEQEEAEQKAAENVSDEELTREQIERINYRNGTDKNSFNPDDIKTIVEENEDGASSSGFVSGVGSTPDGPPQSPVDSPRYKGTPEEESEAKQEENEDDASALAVSGWSGNCAWKKPARKYALQAPIKAEDSDSEEEDEKKPLGAMPNFSNRKKGRRETIADPLGQEEKKRAAYVVAALPDARFRQRGSGLWGKAKSGVTLFEMTTEEAGSKTTDTVQDKPPTPEPEPASVVDTQTEEEKEPPEVPPLPEIPEPVAEEKPKKKNRRNKQIEDPAKIQKEKAEGEFRYTFQMNDITATMGSRREVDKKTEDKQGSEGLGDGGSVAAMSSVSSMSSVYSGMEPPKEEVIDIEMLIEVIKMEEAEKAKMQSWLAGRLALSQQACRFELPMDMKVLEKMTPGDYLSQFCVISTRRSALYNKVFTKFKDKQGKIIMKDLDRALREVLINTITSEDIKQVVELAQLEDNTKVDLKLFSGLAAMAERILYPKYLTEDTLDIPDHKKEKIECADFSSLEWKFHGVQVNKDMRRILESL